MNFIPTTQALQLKELGFNKPCVAEIVLAPFDPEKLK